MRSEKKGQLSATISIPIALINTRRRVAQDRQRSCHIALQRDREFRPVQGCAQGRAAQHLRRGSGLRNNVFFTDFRQKHIGRIDAKTGEVKLFGILTPSPALRRGQMDAQDRLWFG